MTHASAEKFRQMKSRYPAFCAAFFDGEKFHLEARFKTKTRFLRFSRKCYGYSQISFLAYLYRITIMPRFTAADLVDTIAQLGLNRSYLYVSGLSRIVITNIQKPEGPISFNNVNKNGAPVRSGSISVQQLAKIAFICACRPNYPIHIDRVFNAGGNTRSAMETLLAYTPHYHRSGTRFPDMDSPQ